ncbi:hypothetical protein AGMMS49546_23800 [Spirochaetia bacterium]|nr:hypothetical protein AGMMS49546_23800 [Spirochaetia bacterium]
MKDLSEYTEATSEYELLSFLYDKVISREITVFSQLMVFAGPIIRSQRTHPVIMRVFGLIKQLYWGFFSDITLSTHKKLWRELVIPDKVFPEAGDLKPTLQISDLYIVMLDIHGYTQFCMDSRKNLSMMHTLDHAMVTEVSQISAQCQAVSRRERGDEMVVIAPSATDAITVTLSILDFFGKTNIVNDPKISTRRTGDSLILPTFKITAGITGGNTTSPLILTEQGDLSGFLLNSGARLQTRANELSPKESRIMVARQVYMNYIKENQTEKSTIFKNNAVYFFDTGIIEFKGVQIPTCEAVFKPEERYKEKFSEELVRLFGSIKENLWEQRIFQDIMNLLAKAAGAMPPFNVTLSKPVNNMREINNDSFIQFCRVALKAYMHDEDYPLAIGFLHDFIDIISLIPQFDRIILDYLHGATDKYDLLLQSYQETIDKQIEDKAAQIFSGNYLKAWSAAKNGAAIYEKLKAIGRKSSEITKKKVLWYNLIKANQENMGFVLHSGKK